MLRVVVTKIANDKLVFYQGEKLYTYRKERYYMTVVMVCEYSSNLPVKLVPKGLKQSA